MSTKSEEYGETQDGEGATEPGSEDTATSTSEESPDPASEEDGSEGSADADSGKPWKTRAEREAFFAGKASSRSEEIDVLREQGERTQGQLDQLVHALNKTAESERQEPDSNGTEPNDEELNNLWRTNPTEASRIVTRQENERNRELDRADRQRESSVSGASDRLFSRFEEFNDPRDPFSVEVDKVFKAESRQKGYTPAKGTMEFWDQLKAAAIDVERLKPKLRKNARPTSRDTIRKDTRDVMDDDGTSNIPQNRGSSRLEKQSEADTWSDADEKIAQDGGLADKDGKIPERVKTGILRSRKQIKDGRHPNFTRDTDLLNK